MELKQFHPHKRIKHSKYNKLVSILLIELRVWFYLFVLHKKIHPLYAFITLDWAKLEHDNWGDDINVFFLTSILEEHFFLSSFRCYPLRGYTKHVSTKGQLVAIGSVMHHISDSSTIVWGAGINDGSLPKCQPQIKAVRGPLTRQLLLENGIDCPPVYGDPALLLPYYYQPLTTKKYKVGIVLHYFDAHHPISDVFSASKDVAVIRLYDYKKWTDVIDKINSCEHILSSSLHGLVVAQAYQIPYRWVELGGPLNNKSKNRFKFYDFFASLGLFDVKPLEIEMIKETKDLLNLFSCYQKTTSFSVLDLVASCPYTLKKPLTPFK